MFATLSVLVIVVSVVDCIMDFVFTVSWAMIVNKVSMNVVVGNLVILVDVSVVFLSTIVMFDVVVGVFVVGVVVCFRSGPGRGMQRVCLLSLL